MKLSQIVSISAHPKGTLIQTTSHHVLVPQSVRGVLNDLCHLGGSTLAGRLAFARKLTQRQRMVPLPISSACLLLPTGGLKAYETRWVNWYHLGLLEKQEWSASMLEIALKIAHHEPEDYAILQVLKGSHIHE